ncbi:Uncharacterized conserved protein [hydrothermal vent metagenome]|uniref:Uncharacterized conserved protein n=1 Tax=hydrothermal vent metagenome TaxID=652676 RepID=A0A1W1E9N0_9ZZZZ
MKYQVVSDNNFEQLTFEPTIIIGFYRSSLSKKFLEMYHNLVSRYKGVTVIGCSSGKNIADTIPYVETEEQFPIVYLCCNMHTDAFTMHLISDKENIDKKKLQEQMILFSSFTFSYLEKLLLDISTLYMSPKVYGGVASCEEGCNKNPTIFYDGIFYENHVLLWCIDKRTYCLEGISIHFFQPASTPLEITKSENKTIIELNGLPALDVIEEMTGQIDRKIVGRFGYPLFLQKNMDIKWSNTPLASMVSIDRKKKTVTLYRDIREKEYVKIGIMISEEEQLKNLCKLCEIAPEKSVAIVFNCVGITENLKMMEFLYLRDIKEHIDITYAGFHTFGEIGRGSSSIFSKEIMLHNQTMTIAMISKKDEI